MIKRASAPFYTNTHSSGVKLLEFPHPTALAFNLAYFLEEEPDLEDEEEEDDPWDDELLGLEPEGVVEELPDLE